MTSGFSLLHSPYFNEPPPNNEPPPTDASSSVCPRCGLPTRRVSGRFGPFVGCTGFPRCRHTQQISDAPPLSLDAPREGGSAPSKRASLVVRVEMETDRTLRVWCGQGEPQQELLGTLLSALAAHVEPVELTAGPRADWRLDAPRALEPAVAATTAALADVAVSPEVPPEVPKPDRSSVGVAPRALSGRALERASVATREKHAALRSAWEQRKAAHDAALAEWRQATEARKQAARAAAQAAQAAARRERVAAKRASASAAAAVARRSALFNLGDHDEVVSRLRHAHNELVDGGGSGALRILEVPPPTRAFFLAEAAAAAEAEAAATAEAEATARVAEQMGRVPARLGGALLGFQRRGVERLLRWGGRGLLADEMGLGKTVQAIACLAALRPWPALLVVPASLRLMWAEELERWLAPSPLSRADVWLIAGSGDALHQDAPTPKLVITSFRMATVLRTGLAERPWRAVVVDESHALSSRAEGATDAQQTEAVAALASRAAHLLLLSGTPSLSRPFCIYRQVEMLWPGLLGAGKWAYGREYCATVHTAIGRAVPLGGGMRDWELHLLLRRAVMVRRRKAEVLIELPPKRRRWLKLPITTAKGDGGGGGGGGGGGDGDGGGGGGGGDAEEEEGTALALAVAVGEEAEHGGVHHQTEYEAAGVAKLDAALLLIGETLRALEAADEGGEGGEGGEGDKGGEGEKLVVFAHHRRVLDGLQAALHARGPLVRIDGSTPLPQRHLALRRFKTEPSLRLALVSVTAASLGIDLSAAATVIFAELPPDAAWLAQAEDRCHRKGQRNAVNVTILLAHAVRGGGGGGEGGGGAVAAAQLAACRFDSRHAAALRQSERAVRRVTDGPRARGSGGGGGDGGGSVDEAEAEATSATIAVPVEPQQHDAVVDAGTDARPPQLRPSPHFASGSGGSGCGPLVAAPSTRRVRPRLEANEGAPEGVRWGVAHVPRRYGGSAPMPLAVGADGAALCLGCFVPLRRPPTGLAVPTRTRARPSPAQALARPDAGPQAWPLGDAELFCGGGCRADHFARRDTGALRRQTGGGGGGGGGGGEVRCAACGLDVLELCQALCEAPPGEARAALLRSLAPAIAAHDKLAAPLLEAPHLSGRCWHADHVVAVADGGGECTVANMQVLCVACHVVKSSREGRERRERRLEVRTT